MAYETIELDVRDGVAHITLNRPERANAVNAPVVLELQSAVLAVRSDRAVRAVLLTGAGARFCGGGDLASFSDQDDLPAHLHEMLGPTHFLLADLVRGDLPVVAGVHGSVAGIGLGLMSASDLVVAGESTRFVMAYTNAGLTPDGATTWFLPRLVGLRRALDLTLTNRVLTAQEALDWGLVNRVVPDDRVLDEARALATQLARGPTRAFAAAKRLLHTSLEDTLETHLAREAEGIVAAAGTADAHEGITAFLEKRSPDFHGE